VVEQDVRLRRLQPVHLADDAFVAGVRGPFEHRGVVFAESVVVVVETVDVAEPEVDRVLLVMVPVRGDGALVLGAQDVVGGGGGRRVHLL